MKVGFLFGAGAEVGYKMPSGGKFALDIFRQDTTSAKSIFKDMRESIDPTSNYASTWLPIDYQTRSIGTFGKSVFESIIKDTIEHNREKIICQLNSFDELANGIVDIMSRDGKDVDCAIQMLTGRAPDNISMSQTIVFTEEFHEGDRLFGNHYFSALLLVYKQKGTVSQTARDKLGRIITAILQLQIGALGEKLTRKISENLFKKKDDAIDVFDDLGDIMQLNYRASGVMGLEILLDNNETLPEPNESIVVSFATQLLEDIFASVLDYKSLIDSNWHYLYCPKVEWNKFCKISIFLHTVKEYIEKQCKKADLSNGGYYEDLKEAQQNGVLEINAVATTNYTNIIASVLGKDIYYLNGATNQSYDPYLNKIYASEEKSGNENHFVVPLMFTQSGTKPMTSIGMSITYVNVYNNFKDADYICSIGFGFNPDDEHINGVIRTLIEEGKKLIIIEPQKATSEYKRAKDIAEALKVNAIKNVTVWYIDKNSRKTIDTSILWTEALAQLGN